MKRQFEKYDYDEELNAKPIDPSVKKQPVFILFKFQLSGIIGLTFLFLSLLFLSQTEDFKYDRPEYYSNETFEQRQFRLRQMWTFQSYHYQSLIISAIWFGIKILMSINRSHR